MTAFAATTSAPGAELGPTDTWRSRHAASELDRAVKAAVQKRELRVVPILARTTSCSGNSSPRAAGSSRCARSGP